MIEPAFYELANKQISDARKDSEERTKKAVEQAAKPDTSSAPVEGSAAAQHKDDEPVATAEQLVGNENIRFQGMRLAYFTLDRESKLGCLEKEDVKGRSEGDKIILNRIVSLKEDAGKSA